MRLVGFLRAWEAVQVELHGRYSLPRLASYHEYSSGTSLAKAIAITATMPLPCMLVMLFLDSLPYKPASAGIDGQSFGFWLRAGLTGTLITLLVLAQLQHAVPSLRISTARLWGISIGLGFYLLAITYALDKLVGFPIPFMLMSVTVPYCWAFLFLLWFLWRDTWSENQQARHDLQRYMIVLWTQGGLIILDGLKQTLFSALLPLIKLVFKNIVVRGVLHVEDLAPTIVIFNVDVFHAVFLSGPAWTAVDDDLHRHLDNDLSHGTTPITRPLQLLPELSLLLSSHEDRRDAHRKRKRIE